MITSKFHFLTILVLTLFVTACKKSDAPKPTPAKPAPIPLPVTNADVYVAGTALAANGNYVATYWKNGIATAVADSSVSSAANAIAIQGTDIYMAGYTIISPGFTVATYWKNGVAVYVYGVVTNTIIGSGDSTGTAFSTAYAIAVHGNDVYLAGTTYTNPYPPFPLYELPTWWKNGVPSDTIKLYNGNSSDPESALLSAIAVQGDTVCTAGTVNGNLDTFQQFYTQGNFYETLGWDLSGVFGIALKGSDVYVAGYAPARGNIFFLNATYWKNGVPVNLHGSLANSEAYAITLQGTDVFTAGLTFSGNGAQVAVYWKNSVATEITTGSCFNAIAVSGGDIYLAGQNSAGYAAYWINGVMAQLPGKGSVAKGIAIISK